MKDLENIPDLMADIGARAKVAATALAGATAERKHAALISAAEALWRNRADILEANAKDLDFGRDKGLSDAMICLLYTSPSPRDRQKSRMPSSA